MKYPAFLIAAIFLVVESCNTKRNSNLRKANEALQNEKIDIERHTPGPERMSHSMINILVDSAMLFGNKDAYSKVTNAVDFLGPDLLFAAFVMANKYNDSSAYYHVYHMFCKEGYNRFSLELGTVDKKTEMLGLYYLLRSYELGFARAKREIEIRYIEKNLPVPKSSDFIIFK